MAAGDPLRLRGQLPVKETPEDYAGRSRERLLVGPLVERLVAARGSAEAAG